MFTILEKKRSSMEVKKRPRRFKTREECVKYIHHIYNVEFFDESCDENEYLFMEDDVEF